MLSDTLGASLFGSMLASKGFIWADKGASTTSWTRQGVIQAGDEEMSLKGQSPIWGGKDF